MAKVFKTSKSCYEKIEGHSETQLVRDQIIPGAKSDPAKRYELLNSNNVIKENQKKPLGIFIMMDKECDQAFEVGLIGSPWHKPRKELNLKLHALYDDLLFQRISIGFFNRKANEYLLDYSKGMIKAKDEDMANQAGNLWYYNNVINPPLGSGNIFIFR
jgi:hypothetical protein